MRSALEAAVTWAAWAACSKAIRRAQEALACARDHRFGEALDLLVDAGTEAAEARAVPWSESAPTVDSAGLAGGEAA